MGTAKWGKPKTVSLERLSSLNNIEAEKARLRQEREKLFKEYDFVRLRFVGVAFTEEQKADFSEMKAWFNACKRIEEEFENARAAILNPPRELFEKYEEV